MSSARDLAISPGGTLLVSDPRDNKVYALPDKNKDGMADEKKVVISRGNHVHGLAFYKDMLFVAEMDKVVRFTWNEGSMIAAFDKQLFTLPQNNNHNNRTLAFDSKGNLFVSVGSTCNVCVEQSPFSATVLISNTEGENPRVYAKGLRNAPFLTIDPASGDLWGTEMGRDFLGDDLPPDEINILRDGVDYGWPYCYGNKVHDGDFDKTNSHSCQNTVAPLFEIPAHSAPLGLAFIDSAQFPNQWQGDLLVSYHGSWNRTVPTGYKVVHMKVAGDRIVSSEDFLTGFSKDGQVLGRPVDIVFDNSGNLYVSDDKAGAVYIIEKEI
jgi:glucose/arabinose dehydrogenase